MISNSIEITATPENLEEAGSFVRKRLKRSNISKEIQSETLLVFDALCRNIVSMGLYKDTLITIRTRKSFGEIDINLGFEGLPLLRSVTITYV